MHTHNRNQTEVPSKQMLETRQHTTHAVAVYEGKASLRHPRKISRSSSQPRRKGKALERALRMVCWGRALIWKYHPQLPCLVTNADMTTRMVLNTQLSDTRRPLQRTWQAPKTHLWERWYNSLQYRMGFLGWRCLSLHQQLRMMTAARVTKPWVSSQTVLHQMLQHWWEWCERDRLLRTAEK